MNELATFRALKDQFFAEHPQSPLTPEQQQMFAQGAPVLSYFPEHPALRIEVTVEPFPEQREVALPTSTGDVGIYRRYGRLTFTVVGNEVALTLYANHQGYFLPFADALAGTETYGAGRYLDPKAIGDGRFLLDFNLAYNPYCAYNEQWSCPITPRENRLAVPIRAGERLFIHS